MKMEAFLLEASGSGRGDITGVGTETEGEECELPPTGCTPEEQAAQNKSLSEIHNNMCNLAGSVEAIMGKSGRLVAEGTALSQGMRAEYWHQDHLGNTRLAFSDCVVQDGVIETQDDPNTPQDDIEITQAEAKRKSRFLPGSCTTTYRLQRHRLFGMVQLGSCTVRCNCSAGGLQHRSPGQRLPL